MTSERPPRDIDAPARRHVELMRQAARDVRRPKGVSGGDPRPGPRAD